jgi:hypothetical protein
MFEFGGENHLTLDSVSYCFSQAVGEVRKSAIALHRQRYLEVGFMPENFQDPYEKDSIYFVAQQQESFQVVGVCRLVLQDLRTLPTYAHFDLSPDERQALHQLKPGTYAELGALTKLPHHHGMTPGLIETALSYAASWGMTHVLCCIDQDFFRSVRVFLDIPVQVIGSAQPFYGSIKIPCVVSVPEALARLRARKPQAFQHLLPGAEVAYSPVKAA